MTQYELAVLFDPQLEIDLSKPMAKIEKLIKDNKGNILKTDNWGKRKLAYSIAGQENAVYVFYTLELPAEALLKIESTLNITDEVLRYLLTKIDQKAIEKAETAKALKAAKAKERGETSEDDKDDEDDTKE